MLLTIVAYLLRPFLLPQRPESTLCFEGQIHEGPENIGKKLTVSYFTLISAHYIIIVLETIAASVVLSRPVPHSIHEFKKL